MNWTDKELYEEELRREQNMIDSGASEYLKQSEKAEYKPWNNYIVKQIVQNMKEALEAFDEYYLGPGFLNGESGSIRYGANIVPLVLLRSADLDVVAFIATKLILEAAYTKSKVTNAAMIIGSKIEDQIRFDSIEKNAPYLLNGFKLEFRNRHFKDYTYKRDSLIKAEKKMLKGNSIYSPMDIKRTSWTDSERVQVGTFLMEVLRENVLFNGHTIIRVMANKAPTDEYRTVNTIELTKESEDWLSEFKEFIINNQYRFKPLCIAPRDWVSSTEGGYWGKLSLKVPLIKGTLPVDGDGQRDQLERLTLEQMPKVYKAVNKLQSVAWVINEPVFDIMQEAISSGSCLGVPDIKEADRPPAPVPERFKHLRGIELMKSLSGEEKERFLQWRREVSDMYTEEKKRVNDLKKLIIELRELKELAKYPALYFVYTLDFRGRIYALGRGVNPQGSDKHRGLLKFRDGKELGDEGVYWLAVHGANMYGVDGIAKAAFNDRYRLIISMSEQIELIASDPFTHRTWAYAKAPWQFLAFCIEWKSLQEHIRSGKKQEEFVSNLPVHLDATASGLQHHSMMIRDREVGSKVNLISGPSVYTVKYKGIDKFLNDPRYNTAPSDIYQIVADKTYKELKEIAECTDTDTGSIDEGDKGASGSISGRSGRSDCDCTPADLNSREIENKGASELSIETESVQGLGSLGEQGEQGVFLRPYDSLSMAGPGSTGSSETAEIKGASILNISIDTINSLDRLKNQAFLKLRANGLYPEYIRSKEKTFSLPLHMSQEEYNRLFADKYGEYKPKNNLDEDEQVEGDALDTLDAQVKAKVGKKIPKLTNELKVSIAKAWLSLGPKFDRKIAKSTVMTSIYGSTKMRCRENLKQYIKDMGLKPFSLRKDDKLNMWTAVDVCSMVMWGNMEESISSSMRVIKYIKQLASLLPKGTKRVEWTTPTGFIVQHLKFKGKIKVLNTHLMGRCKLNIRTASTQSDIKSLASSIAPHFTQSYDAAHCAMAISRCDDNDIRSIGSVHDSFACNAGDVSVMRLCLIDSFIDLYKDHDALESFRKDLLSKLQITDEVKDVEALLESFNKMTNLPALSKGDLSLEDVRESVYLFS